MLISRRLLHVYTSLYLYYGENADFWWLENLGADLIYNTIGRYTPRTLISCIATWDTSTVDIIFGAESFIADDRTKVKFLKPRWHTRNVTVSELTCNTEELLWAPSPLQDTCFWVAIPPFATFARQTNALCTMAYVIVCFSVEHKIAILLHKDEALALRVTGLAFTYIAWPSRTEEGLSDFTLRQVPILNKFSCPGSPRENGLQ